MNWGFVEKLSVMRGTPVEISPHFSDSAVVVSFFAQSVDVPDVPNRMFRKQTFLRSILFAAFRIWAVALRQPSECVTSVYLYTIPFCLVCPWTYVMDCMKRDTSYFSNRCRLSFCHRHARDRGVIQMVGHGKDFNRLVVAASFPHAWLIKAVSGVSEREKHYSLAASLYSELN